MDASVLVEPSPIALPHLRRCGFDRRRRRRDRGLALPCRPLLRLALPARGDGRGRRRPHGARGGAAGDRGPPGPGCATPGGALGLRAGPHQPRPALRRGRRHLAGGRRPAVPCRRGRSTSPTCAVSATSSSAPVRWWAIRATPRRVTGSTSWPAAADVLVVECNGRHTPPGADQPHGRGAIRALQAAHPGVHLVLTHLGEQVDLTSLSGVTVPDDFDRLTSEDLRRDHVRVQPQGMQRRPCMEMRANRGPSWESAGPGYVGVYGARIRPGDTLMRSWRVRAGAYHMRCACIAPSATDRRGGRSGGRVEPAIEAAVAPRGEGGGCPSSLRSRRRRSGSPRRAPW